ncbi:hypothetical protein M0804_003734 [Polistes exclamans]|nr:hypothetical protein M0804_003734 [Polistes exclamans]
MSLEKLVDRETTKQRKYIITLILIYHQTNREFKQNINWTSRYSRSSSTTVVVDQALDRDPNRDHEHDHEHDETAYLLCHRALKPSFHEIIESL